jgi:hypothetical protein
MIHEASRAAFADELTKISQDMGARMRAAMHAGWNGLDHNGKAMEGTGWALGNSGWKSKVPLGGKALTAVTTGMMLPGAIAKNDPTGRDRSRAERVMGLAGNTIGGMVGTGALMRTIGGKHPIIANLAGGLLGGSLGERIATSPFAAKRLMRRNPAAPLRGSAAAPNQRPADNGWRNVAPGGNTMTPDAITGQAQAM